MAYGLLGSIQMAVLQKSRWELSVQSREEERGTSSTLSTTRHVCGVMLPHAWNTELRGGCQGVCDEFKLGSAMGRLQRPAVCESVSIDAAF